jgi:hypothetical protein
MKMDGQKIAFTMVIGFVLMLKASAQLQGSDDFNSGTVDTSKWGSDINSGVGIFTQTGGHLQATWRVWNTGFLALTFAPGN